LAVAVVCSAGVWEKRVRAPSAAMRLARWGLVCQVMVARWEVVVAARWEGLGVSWLLVWGWRWWHDGIRRRRLLVGRWQCRWLYGNRRWRQLVVRRWQWCRLDGSLRWLPYIYSGEPIKSRLCDTTAGLSVYGISVTACGVTLTKTHNGWIQLGVIVTMRAATIRVTLIGGQQRLL
jgi:hypothetical protein